MWSPLMNRSIIFIILGILFLQKKSDGSQPIHVGLRKRSLLTFPPSSLLQVNMGITLSGNFEKNSAVIALAFQQYAPLPENTQLFSTPSVLERGKKSIVYHHLRDVISSYGFNGSECLQKMICQVGESPLVGGLLEDIITLVLTPSRHRKIPLNDSSDKPLLESEELGRRGENCTSAYPQCVITPLDLISTLIHL